MKSAGHVVIASGWMSRIASASARLALTATIVFVVCVSAVIATSAQTYSTIYSFTGTNNKPSGPLVQGTDGNLYGVTANGGTTSNGSIFKVTPQGQFTTLYSFCAQNQCSGGTGLSGLIQGTNGNFYGAYSYPGYGAAFEITPAGKLTTLYTFCSLPNCSDGEYPNGPLLQGMDGNFYGTTHEGGANGAGTVYKLTPSGTLTTLYDFCSQAQCADGSSPYAGVIQDAAGNLYGTTNVGGNDANQSYCNYGCGVAYKLSPSGVLTTLYAFCSLSGCADGFFPQSTLVFGSDGNLYGTTSQGGTDGFGTAFRLTPGGTLTTLHTFCVVDDCTDGYEPGQLIEGSDSNIYGMTLEGGGNGSGGDGGSIYRITTKGTFTVVYSNNSNNLNPLVEATNGKLYGTTMNYSTGGSSIFSFSLGLNPFVETQTSSGAVGASVVILGNNLTGATSVTFNGTKAKFTVVSASEIEATVPAGATTGTVVVTTPTSTLKSNAPFQILPVGTWHIQNVNSGLYLSILGASLSNGADVVQWSSTGSLDQEWTLKLVGNGIYQITDVNSGLLMGVLGASTDEGASVVQWQATGSLDQEWQLSPVGSNWLITDINSGLVMGVEGNFTGDGAQLIQWPADGSTSQVFTLVPVE
jgi:uncharacterized repeat protein (TIGR03803 family)